MKKIAAILFCAVMVLGASSCGKTETSKTDASVKHVEISLNGSSATVNGEEISKDSASEIYSANDIIYYEAGKDFTYGDGSEKDAHTAEEAAANTVVHIAAPGNYVLSGELKGQIAVDLGEDASSDPDAKVTLYFKGLNINCDVAPAVIFYNVYECGSKDAENASSDYITEDTGAKIMIVDGTENTVNGSYVAKIYESYKLNGDKTEVESSKTLHKYDGAIYSKMSMSIFGGTGVLNVNAENEGIDSELHLSVYGGNINIKSGDDGINTNEDGVSVMRVIDGNIKINVDGAHGEGDGIDSNGWIVLDGGSITTFACSDSEDSGLDSDNGIIINGGSVISTGNMFDEIKGGSANYAVFDFGQKQNPGSAYKIVSEQGVEIISFKNENAFKTLVIASPLLSEGKYSLYSNGNLTYVTNSMDPGAERPEPSEGGKDGMPVPPEGMSKPEGEPPQKPEGEKPSVPPKDFDPSKADAKPPMPSDNAPDMPPNAEAIALFEIVSGGNMFRVMSR